MGMNEILHANIFFVIASIATVIFCIMICLILYHAIKIIKSLRRIIDRIEAGSEVIASEVANVRELISSGGLVGKMFHFFTGSKRSSRRRKKQTTND
jgi:hypothetical protein